MRPPRRVQLYVWCVVVTAVGIGIAVGVLDAETPTQGDWIMAVVLGATVMLARAVPIQLAPRTRVAADTAAAFAAVLLLPPPLAIVATTLALAASGVFQPSILVQQAFNIAQGVLAVSLGAATVAFLTRDGVNGLSDSTYLWSAFIAAIVMYVTNVALIDGIISLQQRRRPFERWWAMHHQHVWQEISLFLLGLLVAVVAEQHAWALGLLAVPTIVVYRSLRDGVALKYQTRQALEELADIVDLRDRYTHGHCRRVADLSGILARRVGLAPDEVERIMMAARVHDVGKIGIKSTVLMKPGDLTDVEWIEMRSHPEIGARVILKFPEFASGAEMVLSHHEWWNGDGYPRGLAGERIPLGARVIAVADAWDAMVSHRAYRQAMDLDLALAEMERGRGSQFEPRLVDAFIVMLRERPDLARQHTEITQEIDIAEERPAAV